MADPTSTDPRLTVLDVSDSRKHTLSMHILFAVGCYSSGPGHCACCPEHRAHVLSCNLLTGPGSDMCDQCHISLFLRPRIIWRRFPGFCIRVLVASCRTQGAESFCLVSLRTPGFESEKYRSGHRLYFARAGTAVGRLDSLPGCPAVSGRRAGWPRLATAGHGWPRLATAGHGGPRLATAGHG